MVPYTLKRSIGPDVRLTVAYCISDAGELCHIYLNIEHLVHSHTLLTQTHTHYAHTHTHTHIYRNGNFIHRHLAKKTPVIT